MAPQDWKDSAIICIPKKGNLAECDKGRGVTLLSIPSKVYCLMILNQLRDIIDGKL